jgi:hypothetical protein
MTAKENFRQLTGKVNESQAKVKAAATKNRAQLQAQVGPGAEQRRATSR